jgi:hypothetical protein
MLAGNPAKMAALHDNSGEIMACAALHVWEPGAGV